jgi:hypothetical protein
VHSKFGDLEIRGWDLYIVLQEWGRGDGDERCKQKYMITRPVHEASAEKPTPIL